MSSDMEDSTRLSDLSDRRSQHHHRHHYHHHRDRTFVGEIGDDECSTDSGCSSSSTESGKRLSRHSSGERLCRSSRSPRTQCYLDRLRGRARSQEKFSSSVQRSSERTLSPENVKSLSQDGVSPLSYLSSPSDVHSSSDSDSLKPSTTETLRRAFQSFKITSSKWNKEKKHVKKSPKKILRSPVPYMYVRGLSGLPTQRVPRNSGFPQMMKACSCQDLVELY